MLGRTSVRSLVTVALIALLAVAVGLWSQSTARADCTGQDPLHCDDVTTSAGVGNSGNPPVIECKWELPDADPNTAGMQYGNDDDTTTSPGPPVPCDLAGGTGAPTMVDGVRHMIQVHPNLEDQDSSGNTSLRHIELWMAAEDPLGLGDINAATTYFIVYEPAVSATLCPDHSHTPGADGAPAGYCFKVQVHPDRIPVADCVNSASDYLGSGTGPAGTMFKAAVDTGQMTPQAVDNSNAMIILCREQQKALYRGAFDLSKDQPCGQYEVALTVSGSQGSDTLTNWIDVQCVFGLQIDFSAVDWTTISPGVTKQVFGDAEPETPGAWNPPNSAHPTVKNVGNDGMGLSVLFTQMWDPPHKQSIDNFDAAFGRDSAHLDGPHDIAYNNWLTFDSDPYRVLCANEQGKLDLSIHPPTPLTPATFSGKLNILGVARLGMCKGSHHVP